MLACALSQPVYVGRARDPLRLACDSAIRAKASSRPSFDHGHTPGLKQRSTLCGQHMPRFLFTPKAATPTGPMRWPLLVPSSSPLDAAASEHDQPRRRVDRRDAPFRERAEVSIGLALLALAGCQQRAAAEFEQLRQPEQKIRGFRFGLEATAAERRRDPCLAREPGLWPGRAGLGPALFESRAAAARKLEAGRSGGSGLSVAERRALGLAPYVRHRQSAGRAFVAR
jgi:hypothetical protein